MKTKDVEDLIENYPDTLNDREAGGYGNNWSYWVWEVGSDTITVPGLGQVTIVDSETGGEGAAEHIYMVFKVEFQSEDGKWNGPVRYYEKTGYYVSYDGSTWDGGFYRVDPKQVTVTKYARVKED